ELQILGIKVISGGHPADLMEKSFDLVVKNPGIPYDNPVVFEALKQKVPVITEVEVATSVMESSIIGVTGTNGKTTTTSIINKTKSACNYRNISSYFSDRVFNHRSYRNQWKNDNNFHYL